MSSVRDDSGNNDSPFGRSITTPRTPPSTRSKRPICQLSPSQISPSGKRVQRSISVDLVDSPVDSSRNSLERNADYEDMVREASECLSRINATVNDATARLNVSHKSTIMDLTQRVTSIVSLLAIKSLASEKKLAEAECARLLVAQTAPMVTEPSEERQSYSDKLKLRLPKQMQSIKTRAPLPCVVAYPTAERASEITTSDATKEALMKAIKPSDGFQIVGVKKTSKSGVVLRVSNEAQIQKLRSVNAIKSAGLRLEKPKGRKPRILVKDVPGSMDDDNFLHSLFNQNIKDEIKMTEEDFLKSSKIVRRRPVANGRKWIGVEITPEVRSHLMSTKDKLFIDWAMCRVEDDVEVVRCHKCQLHGHVIKYCSETKFTCAHCAGEHESRECTKKSLADFTPICASCKRFKKPHDHATGSSGCPSYVSKLEQLILNTTYG